MNYYDHDSPEDGWHPDPEACPMCEKSDCICDLLTDAWLEDDLEWDNE